jgi:hypothetical protein
VIHGVPGKGWLSAIHTPEGMRVPKQSTVLPVKMDAKAEIVSSEDGEVWAGLHRKKVTVQNSSGDTLQELPRGKGRVTKKVTVRVGSNWERPPLAMSPKGGWVAVLLEGDGGNFLRLWRVEDGQEETVPDVQDVWFLDEDRCLVVATDGSLAQRCLATPHSLQEGSNLTRPVRGLAAALELPEGRTLVMYEEAGGKLFHGTEQVAGMKLELENVVDGAKRISLSSCGGYVAEGAQGGVITIYKLADGSDRNLRFDGAPEWLEVALVPGWVWGLTVNYQLEVMPWSSW